MTSLIETPEATFLQVAEVWIPEGEVLKHAGGDYAGKDKFAHASTIETFAMGEGLPGKAWAEQRPFVLKKFDGSYFKRTEAAKEAGLTSAVAIPIFAKEELKAVLVVLCGGDDEHVGAIKVWENHDDALYLDNGYYGTTAKFEDVTKGAAFYRGQGLPGSVWASNMPVVLRDLGESYGFVRAESASKAGFKTGIGLPIPVPGTKTFIATLLSAPNTPIANRFEIWDARRERVGHSPIAIRIDGICKIEGPLWPKDNPPTDIVTAKAWQGPIGQVLGTGRPHVVGNGAGLPADYRSMIALPIYHEAEIAYVVAWYL